MMKKPKQLAMDSWSAYPRIVICGRPPGHQVILLHIAHYNLTRSEEKQPSATTLAKDCGMSKKTFLLLAKQLENDGILLCVRGKNGGSNRYYLNRTSNKSTLVGQNATSNKSTLVHGKTSNKSTLVGQNATSNKSTLVQKTSNKSTLVFPRARDAHDNIKHHCDIIKKNTKKSNLQLPKKSKKSYTGGLKNDEIAVPAEIEEKGLLDPCFLEQGAVTSKWILKMWSEVAHETGFPIPRLISDRRVRQIKLRICDFPKQETWLELFARLRNSPHLAKESWFNFDFVIASAENFEKVLRGWMDWKKEEQNEKRAKNKLPVDQGLVDRLRKGASRA